MKFLKIKLKFYRRKEFKDLSVFYLKFVITNIKKFCSVEGNPCCLFNNNYHVTEQKKLLLIYIETDDLGLSKKSWFQIDERWKITWYSELEETDGLLSKTDLNVAVYFGKE